MFNKINTFFLWFSYKLSEIKNVYSHKAVGQRTDRHGGTQVLYTILGKRDIYSIRIEDLMDDAQLLSRFHPCQAAKFGAIALGDALFESPADQRESRYQRIKAEMLHPETEQ